MKAFSAAGLSFPWRHRAGPRKGEIDWKPLAHHVVLRILRNPRYAGAFTFGRHRDIILPGGKLSRTVLPREEWISFIPGAHPGYITLEQYDANRARLAANAAAHGRDRAAVPPREGPALLQGIIICGTLLPGAQDPHLGGVHGADEEPGISGGVVGKVPVHTGKVPDSRQISGGDCCLRAGAGRERRGRLSRPGPWSAAGRGSAR